MAVNWRRAPLLLGIIAAIVFVAAGPVGLPSVPNLSALKALAPGQSKYVYRQGFTSLGDGGQSGYTWSPLPCPLGAAGAGDNGAQVKPTTGTGCWLADLHYPLDPRLWGKSINPTPFYATNSGSPDLTGYCLETSATCSPQHALDVAQLFDRHAGIATINLAAGSYPSGLVCSGNVPVSANGFTSPNSIWIVGASSATTTIADVSAASAAIIASSNCRLTLQGLKVTSANGSALFPQDGAEIAIGTDFNVGATAFGQFHPEDSARIIINSSYTISGGAPAHLQAVLGGSIKYTEVNKTVTITGTPAFSDAFATAEDNSVIYIPSANVTFSGSATGSRFRVKTSSTLTTNSGSGTYLPGNALGSVQDNGTYQPTTGPALGTPTGLGTGGSPGVVVFFGGTDTAFSIQLTTGTTGGTPANNGLIPFTFGTKQGINGSVCAGGLTGFSAAWGNGATINAGGQSSAGATMAWTNVNNGALAALAAGQTYVVNVICRGQ
jgi:hypothetical protein